MKAFLSIPLLFLAAPALAGAFTPPKGCTTNLTVQSRGCYVANYYTCTADQPGDQWRADFDQEGMFYLSKIDSETRWIESYDLNPTVKQTLDPNEKDPASFSGLLATGRDDFDFSLSKDNGEHSNVKGYDKLTGKSVTIDGVTLQQTEYDYVETDDAGNELRKAHGHEYISAKWRNFYAGPSEWWNGTEFVPMDSSPMQFIEPGESGFAVTQPLFECDAVMSSLPFSPEIASHDHL
ncbi:MAG: hypothetical protein ACOH2M_00105 [Cypionkella sp.]|jgi:hypothetical protein